MNIKCNGKNCNSTNGLLHSEECQAEHDKVVNGGCKIPVKADAWTVYNNTLPLCELTNEQAAMLFNAWRKGTSIKKRGDDDTWRDGGDKLSPFDAYRVKSERELFIEESMKFTTEGKQVKHAFGEMFDAGARYKDLTQHFGENI